ncbi:MAG: hypothetical protein Q9213_008051, partial [Squamulea squamosa]
WLLGRQQWPRSALSKPRESGGGFIRKKPVQVDGVEQMEWSRAQAFSSFVKTYYKHQYNDNDYGIGLVE